MEPDSVDKNGATAYVVFGRTLAENGLTWEDVKENIPPFVNSIGIDDYDKGLTFRHPLKTFSNYEDLNVSLATFAPSSCIYLSILQLTN